MSRFAVRPWFVRSVWWCCVLLPLMAACAAKKAPITQIVVVVDSDLKVPSELTTVKVDVTGTVNMPSARADLTAAPLPSSLGLVHSTGPLGPVTVTVSGMLGTGVVVKRVAKVSFVQDQSLELRVFLGRACAGPNDTCQAPAETCDNGGCVSAAISKLPTWSGDVVPFGSGADGGMDAAGGGKQDAASDGATPVADTGVATDGSNPMPDSGIPAADSGTPASCSISAPAPGSSFKSGVAIAFSGSCTGPASNGLSWRSSLDGSLSTRASFSSSNLSTGTHVIKLCARQPLTLLLVGCDMVTISVGTAPAITASISSVQQNASSTQPFSTSGGDITLKGVGTGTTPLTFSWKDSIVGSLGTGGTVMLVAPAAGKHVVTLTVTDAQTRTATASTTFDVLTGVQTQIISPYTNVNTTLAGNTAVVPLVAAISSTVYAPDTLQHVYSFDGTMLAANPTLMVNHPPLTAVVQALAFDITNQHAYLGTTDGYQVCNFAVSTGIDPTNCTLFNGTSGGNGLPDLNIAAIARLQGYLLIGTAKGVMYTTTIAGSSTGSRRFSGVQITSLAVRTGNTAYVGSHGNGIYSFDPANGGQSQNFTTSNGLPSNIVRSVAVNELGDAVWVATNAGIARYNPANDNITVWTTGSAPAPGLASNDVRDIKVTRTTINTVTRDVVWIATAAGVSRFDPGIPSFTTFTTSDGLPSNTVTSITFVNGTKVFATDQGLAAYAGP